MTRFAKVELDDFDFDESDTIATMFPLNTETIDLGEGLQVKNDQEIIFSLFTQFPAGTGNRNLQMNLFLNVWAQQDMGSPDPVKGVIRVPTRSAPVQ